MNGPDMTMAAGGLLAGVRDWVRDVTLRIERDLTDMIRTQARQLAGRKAIVADYEVGAGDYLIAVGARSAGVTVTLPDATATPGRILLIKDESGQAATYDISVDAQSGQTIDGTNDNL